jgi:hypothetical protein
LARLVPFLWFGWVVLLGLVSFFFVCFWGVFSLGFGRFVFDEAVDVERGFERDAWRIAWVVELWQWARCLLLDHGRGSIGYNASRANNCHLAKGIDSVG